MWGMEKMNITSETVLNRAMLAYVANMPRKTIEVGGKPYLTRYLVCEHPDGSQEWIHQFLSADGDRHLHSHPWNAQSSILVGGYIEAYLDDGDVKTRDLKPGDTNIITPSHIHRIVCVSPYCWTHMLVGTSRLPQWFFIDEAGNREYMQTSPLKWWENL